MVTIEPIVFTIRIGEENLKMGDPYTTVCTCIKTGPETARITAMVGILSTKQAILVYKELKKLGFQEVIWERRKDGVYQDVVYKGRD